MFRCMTRRAIQRLRHDDAQVRREAIRRLAKQASQRGGARRRAALTGRELTEALIEALGDADPEVVERAVKTVAEITRQYGPVEGAHRALKPLLQSRRQNTRFFALQAIAYSGGIEQLQTILPLVRDRSAKVRAHVCRMVVVTMDSEPARPLTEEARLAWQARLVPALRDEVPLVRQVAADALARVGDRDALSPLTTASSKERFASVAAAMSRALDAIEERPTPE